MSRKEPERTISGVVPFGGDVQPGDGRRIPTHETVRDVTLQEATASSPRTERGAEEQGDRGDRGERMKRTENLHTEVNARERDAKKAKEEAVKKVAESSVCTSVSSTSEC